MGEPFGSSTRRECIHGARQVEAMQSVPDRALKTVENKIATITMRGWTRYCATRPALGSKRAEHLRGPISRPDTPAHS